MSRASRFDRGDFDARYGAESSSQADEPELPTATRTEPSAIVPTRVDPAWPIAHGHLLRIGETVLRDRNGKGRPHKGVDLFAKAGAEVLASNSGQVLRVVDGRKGQSTAQRRAGLFVDVRGDDALVYRYLHLGKVRVAQGQIVAQGNVLGQVGDAYTSGLSEAPHLHFEIRQGDYDSSRKDYGTPLDPLRLLPPLRA